jgi:hypothetical protein
MLRVKVYLYYDVSVANFLFTIFKQGNSYLIILQLIYEIENTTAFFKSI